MLVRGRSGGLRRAVSGPRWSCLRLVVVASKPAEAVSDELVGRGLNSLWDTEGGLGAEGVMLRVRGGGVRIPLMAGGNDFLRFHKVVCVAVLVPPRRVVFVHCHIFAFGGVGKVGLGLRR